MRTVVMDHPLIAHKVTVLRDENTDSPTFRRLANELVTLLAFEATRDLSVERVTVQTPVAVADGVRMSHPHPLVVPILRAGLGMLEGMMQMLPHCEVGFLGMVRNEETLQPSVYADRMPSDLDRRHVFILDPMLATGGTLIASIDLMLARGARAVTCLCLLAAPEGLSAVESAFANRDVQVTVVCAGLDDHLNEKGYIVPGLGDAGDRLFGTV